jgi:acyl-CoA synthetase (AMP-forming)/AMP-acid ligase II
VNLGAFLSAAAARHPDRTAITFESRSLRYPELNARVDALAAGLTGLGLAAGERVVIWLGNCPEFIETFFACWKLGLVAVPVNARLTPADLAFHVADCAATALVHGPEFTAAAKRIPVRHRIAAAGSGSAYEDLAERGRGAPDQTREIADDAAAWLFYTSGTTGRPKGAVLTHGNLTFVTVAWCADLYCLQPEDVVLHCAPLSHAAGFHALVAVARGAHNVLHARFDPAAVLDAIPGHGVTATWLVPTQIRRLLDSATLDRTDLSSLRRVIYGGAPIAAADLQEALRRFGPVLCQLYGQGESPMTISYLRPEDHRLGAGETLTSAGVARTGMEIRIAGPQDRPLPAGQTGEILVRGPAVMAGYHGRPDATADALRDGWLHTGDLGLIDERGFLHVRDRLKDLIITGGSNVYAREVEDVLLRHPLVRDAAVFGVPHRIWGEAVTAVVVGAGGVSGNDVMAFCREHLAGFKCPKQIHIAEELPRNAYGKVLKRELREAYSAGPR